MPAQRLLLVFGGRSSEHEISLRSATEVLAALDRTRYTPILLGIRRDGGWRTGPAEVPLAGIISDGEPVRDLLALRPDLVFPVLHGPHGEDGTFQGLLEVLGLPYVGSGVLASALCMDKALFKHLLHHQDPPIAVVPWIELHADALGTLVALSLVRELGPVVAALLFASRAGSAVTAEIGLMKVTEQLKAMDMMAVSPIARVVAPRFWGGVISMPLLAALFSAMGIFGGWLIGVIFIGVDDGAFWSQMQGAVDFRYDVLNGVIKSAVFGVAVALIAVFEGYDCVPTAEGVSRAITRTVVSSALAILALDFVMTSFMFRG